VIKDAEPNGRLRQEVVLFQQLFFIEDHLPQNWACRQARARERL
jgi:hypothetical protein